MKNKNKEQFTMVEKRLISVINNFILWYTTHEDRELAEEYMSNEHVDYNECFELKKEYIGYHEIREEK